MEKIDVRTHSPKRQHEIRKQVIRLRKQGIQKQILAEGVGISVSHASRIWQSYLKGGSKAIKLKVRGRQKWEKRTFATEQEAHVKRDLIDKTPYQLKLPFHENSSQETGSCTKLFQTSQSCLCCITQLTCSIAGVITNSKLVTLMAQLSNLAFSRHFIEPELQ